MLARGQQRAAALSHPAQGRVRPSSIRGVQQGAMGRSNGRPGALADTQERQSLEEDLGRAWQCEQSDISVGRESTIARLWAG